LSPGIAEAQWSQVPLVSSSAKANGEIGGEGCQVVRSIASDSTGNVLAMITDVGGMYKSTDGAASWKPMNATFKARGGNVIAIDPNNNSVMIADAQGGWGWDGLWRTADQGNTWTNVLPKNEGSWITGANTLVFDPASSQTVYWSTSTNIASGDQGLWASSNNGVTWTHTTTNYAGAFLAMHPTNHTLYVGSNNLYKYANGTFTTILSGPCLGVATSKANPNWIYALRSFDLELSTDGGQTWTKKAGNGLPTSAWAGGPGWQSIKVSPVNSNLLALNHDTGNWADQWHYYSTDGGTNWFVPTHNLPSAGTPFDSSVAWHWGTLSHGFPSVACFSPANANIVWDDGGNQIVKSVNSGSTFQWSNNGYNGVDAGVTGIGGAVTFNVSNANLLALATQDYDLALTTDGGSTWTNLDPAGLGHWNGGNGYVYGAYVFDAQHIVCGVAASWNDTRYIYTTSDGGATWTNTGIAKNYYGKEVGYGDPNNANIGFYGNYRTTNKGATWTAMTGCDGVFTHNPQGSHELYGSSGTAVVKSTDDGATWQNVHSFGGSWLTDVAYDWKNNKVYVCLDTRGVWAYNINTGVADEVDTRLPLDNNNNRNGLSVTCDPIDPTIVYVGNHADIYCSSVGVARSTDSGATWQNLCVANNSQLDGGREPASIRVNPGTRKLWAFGECYGVSTYPAPVAGQSAYNGPHNIPGTLQAEDYDNGGEGVAYHDTDSPNNGGAYRSDGVDVEATTDTGGGYNVGWTAAGEYLKYTVNVAAAGTYTVTFRVASTTGQTGAFHLQNAGGTNLSGAVNVPNTGGWQTFTNVTATVTLPAGTQILTLVEDAANFNLNSMTFAGAGGTITLSGTAGSHQAALSWSAYTGVSSYRVKRSTTSGSGYSWVVTGWGSTSYTNTGLTAGTAYYFVIAALDGSGNELANSNEVKVTPTP